MVKSILALSAAWTMVLGATALYAASNPEEGLKASLAERLPKTKLTAVDCSKITGLCEVQSGANLFYTDRAGRYLVIGRIYDMETRQDLTAARLLEISPETLVGGAARALGAAPGGQPESAPARAEPARTEKVSLASLGDKGAIKWGSGPTTVTVFSDMRCGYCNRLHQTLQEMGVRVIERPISVLGTRSLSEAVICSSNRQTALVRAYRGEQIAPGKCDTSGLDENEAFARANGFTGTPVIVRSDGAVVHGYRPRDFLENWLKGAK